MAELSRPVYAFRPHTSAHHIASTGPFGRIAEQVVVDGSPQQGVPRRVVVFRLPDMQPVATTFSSVAGDYEVRYLAKGQAHIPMAIDHTGQFEAIVAGPVTPTVQED